MKWIHYEGQDNESDPISYCNSTRDTVNKKMVKQEIGYIPIQPALSWSLTVLYARWNNKTDLRKTHLPHALAIFVRTMWFDSDKNVMIGKK
jgi:hypothetical protein